MNISLQLAGLPADAVLEVRLPPESAGVGFEDLLEWVFPLDEEDQALVHESFDLKENPDLPEIYETFLGVIEQSRAGLCRIVLSEQPGSGVPAKEIQEICPAQEGLASAASVSLLLTPIYDTLAYAAEQGYDAGEPDLLEWLQLCTAIYFLDRHEVPLPKPDSQGNDIGLNHVVERILSLGLARSSEDGEGSEITAEGRRFIARLLAETETCIDRYDIFSDVVWDDDTGQALFGTGNGDDLRVETFIAEDVDPVRAVFLLRLYDGSLDGYVADWENLVCSRDFYNRILEPVVDRSVTPADLLDEIADQGLSLLEDTRQLYAERESNARIARRFGDLPGSFPD